MNPHLKRAPMRAVLDIKFRKRSAFDHTLSCGHVLMRSTRRLHAIPCLLCLEAAQEGSTPQRRSPGVA